MARPATWLDGGMLAVLGQPVSVEHLASRIRMFQQDGASPHADDGRMSWSRDARYGEQALLRNYRWYLANLHQFEGQSGVSHRVPWKQGALTIAKLFF